MDIEPSKHKPLDKAFSLLDYLKAPENHLTYQKLLIRLNVDDLTHLNETDKLGLYLLNDTIYAYRKPDYIDFLFWEPEYEVLKTTFQSLLSDPEDKTMLIVYNDENALLKEDPTYSNEGIFIVLAHMQEGKVYYSKYYFNHPLWKLDGNQTSSIYS